MEDMTKMVLSICGMIIFGAIYQIKYGNQGAILIGLIVMATIGFGWYAAKAQDDNAQNMKKVVSK